MWYFYRPDSINALDWEIVKKVLPNYRKICLNEKLANFQKAKRFEIEFDENLELKELIKIHDKALKKFKKQEIDESFEIKQKNLLSLKRVIANKIIESCELCEWKCKVNRKKSFGVCGLNSGLKISSEFVHLGEEAFFVPSHTIFFYSCNLYCVFCQNYEISYRIEKPLKPSIKELARIIDERHVYQKTRNLNLVGGEPTMHLHNILKILENVKVNIPVVWNSNMLMSEISMKLLDGVVDVYLTDFKFSKECAKELSKFEKYWEVVTRNHLIAKKQGEMVIRHLILPNHVVCCSFEILEWISKNLGKSVIVNIMDQYMPHWKALERKDINRRITREEFDLVVKKAEELGLIFIT